MHDEWNMLAKLDIAFIVIVLAAYCDPIWSDN